jgi:hypothetical protein
VRIGSPPAPRSRGRSSLLGLLAGLGVLVLVFYPLGLVLFLAYVHLTGCFTYCEAPQTMLGLGWALLGSALLSVPVGVGLVVGRIRAGRAWAVAPAVGIVLVAAVLTWVAHGDGFL